MGTIGSWLKKVGDKVSAGDSIAEIQTDKATMAFEAQDECYIAKLLVEPGVEVAVGAPIFVSVEDESSVASFANFSAPVAAAAPAAPAPAAVAVPTPAPPAPKPVAVAAPPAAPAKAAPPAPTPAPAAKPAAVSTTPSAAVYSTRWGTGVANSALIGKLKKDQVDYLEKFGRSGQQPI